MSDRRQEQIVSERAELRASHIQQIEVLTKPGLTELERVKQFAKLVGVTNCRALDFFIANNCSAAGAVWHWGNRQNSLFAFLPGGCSCPMVEGVVGLPYKVPGLNWKPTAEVLERFSRVQLERRFPEQVS